MSRRSHNRVRAVGFFIVAVGMTRSASADLVSVSGASFRRGPVAAESMVSAFGLALAPATQMAAVVPLPTLLAGTRVTITDSAGTERVAPLFFVSPGQINYLVPAETRSGPARVTVNGGPGHFLSGLLQVEEVAPGLFSANGDGQGVAAATAMRVGAHGAQAAAPVFRFDAAQRKALAVPIDLGDPSEQVILSIFGTGLRSRRPHPAVGVTIGGEIAAVLSAGPQREFAGLDQVNVRLPRSLVGRGTVDVLLQVDGKTANAVTVEIR